MPKSDGATDVPETVHSCYPAFKVLTYCMFVCIVMQQGYVETLFFHELKNYSAHTHARAHTHTHTCLLYTSRCV